MHPSKDCGTASEALGAEVGERMGRTLQRRLDEFMTDEIATLLETRIANLELHQRASSLLARGSGLRRAIATGTEEAPGYKDDVDAAEKLLAAIAGIALPGLPGFIGAQFGAREMIKSGAPAIAAAAFLFLNPVSLIPTVIILAVGAVLTQNIAVTRLHGAVVKKVGAAWLDHLDEKSNDIAVNAVGAALGLRAPAGSEVYGATEGQSLAEAVQAYCDMVKQEADQIVEETDRLVDVLASDEDAIESERQSVRQSAEVLRTVAGGVAEFRAAVGLPA